MELLASLGIIILAGLLHSSLQLGISMVTLLSGHALGKQRSAKRTLALTTSFYLGSLTMILLIASLITFKIAYFWTTDIPAWLWMTASGLLALLGIALWIAYYRPKQRGTVLWIPRSFARFLSARTKATHATAEAFSLGVTGVLTELIFVIPAALAASLAILSLPSIWQVPGLFIYALVASFGIGLVVILVGGGHHISDIQRWRETHKSFLRFMSGAGAIILGAFLYYNYVVSPLVIGATL